MEKNDFANIIFKYVVKAFDYDIDTAIMQSDDIIEAVAENIPDLYEVEGIPFIDYYQALFPDNEICPIEPKFLPHSIETEIELQRKKCIEMYGKSK